MSEWGSSKRLLFDHPVLGFNRRLFICNFFDFCLGLHDYHDIIKQPMDLGTVKRKMDARVYEGTKSLPFFIETQICRCFLKLNIVILLISILVGQVGQTIEGVP
jgi:hypothetical protein